MTDDHDRALFQRYLSELWNEGNLAAADQLYTSDHVYQDVHLPNLSRGPEGVRERVGYYKRAVPGRVVAVEDWVVEDGKTTCRWLYEGVHRGPLGVIAPTGKAVTIAGVHVCHYRDGRISRSWVMWDRLGTFEQVIEVLGLICRTPGSQ